MIKPRKALENISSYEVDYYKKDWRLKLDSNENVYGCPNCVISTIKNFPQDEISLYPVYGKLIDKIAHKYEIQPNNVLISNGCDEALSIIINSYLDFEEELLTFNPTFSMPALYAKIANGKVRTIEYKEKFIFDKEYLKENISNSTKIIYLATPNNPTGETIKVSVLEMLLKDYKDILFIIDCTYINFSTNYVLEDYIDLTKKYQNVIITKSFSKDFAIAGLRFGLSIANEEIIKNLRKVASPYNVNLIALNCATILINDNKTLDEIRELNEKARELLFNELQNLGFKPYKSEGNFILCDFHSYSNFYFEKLKKNGVIVRKFSKNSPISSCLRITVPKIGGVKYISEILAKKDLLVFDLDGVVFDATNSTIKAIAETFKHFSQFEISQEEILEAKKTGSLDCAWNCVNFLLKKYNIEVDFEEIINVYQNLYFNSNNQEKSLINNEELLISKETFEKINKNYDCVIFSQRTKEEIKYSLKKFDIDKYFYYSVSKDDLSENSLKPNPDGLLKILNHCPYKTVKYFGDDVDDIIAGNKANIETIGVMAPNCDHNSMVNNFRHLCAKHILSETKNIEHFLQELEKENVPTN